MAVHEGKGEFGDPHTVAEVIDCLKKLAGKKGSVSVGDIVDALGTRTFGPLLLVPALLALTPVGALPSAPTVLAIIIGIFAVQMLLRTDHVWIPDIIEKRSVSADKLCTASLKLEPVAERLDRWFHGRLKVLTRFPWVQIAALLVLILCFAVPPLELVPFAAAAPMAAIAAIGLALLVRDGALMVVAIVIGLGAVGLGVNEFMLSSGG